MLFVRTKSSPHPPNYTPARMNPFGRVWQEERKVESKEIAGWKIKKMSSWGRLRNLDMVKVPINGRY
ncbi:MAG: hypothetical protein ACE5GU_12700 [Candidatus Scalinduaceae bacterium]